MQGQPMRGVNRPGINFEKGARLGPSDFRSSDGQKITSMFNERILI